MGVFEFLGGAIKPITDLIDNLTTSDEERAEAKAKLQLIQNDLTSKYLELEAKTVEAKEKVMIAELNQSDNYTKRARPTILYGGMFIMFINNAILPWLAFFKGMKLPTINLPSEFWIAWGGVASVYAFGRTKEKLQGKR